MSRSGAPWIRQAHRWLSIAFTLTVVAHCVGMAVRPGQPPALVTYAPLLPLAVLLPTGLYPCALPYAARRRGARTAVGAR